ncbi:uncharacterized protein LOC128679672 [Plodia interpunctella]|uniref:uncharacterized protein LOC128679672 n=1 Tax=Plodia interpunctella TaxID=58824 RepID=UPI002368C436|nr:uncharacterized protein LOC128679672 [Plodia interpunctella]
MSLSIENEMVKKCFKCEHVLYDNLKIVYNSNTFMIVLWNKFQIFVYEDRNLQNAAKILIPEFQIHQLLLSDNYILCLDSSFNIHTISLKFKNPAQKRLRSSFLPREQNVMACSLADHHALSIKYEGESLFLCLHKINAEFLLEKKVLLKYDNPWILPVPALGKCMLIAHQINDNSYSQIKMTYKANNMPNSCSIVFMSFDKLTIFSCLFSPKMGDDEIFLIKLHTCPTEICGIEIIDDLIILVCLTSGSILQFFLKDVLKEPNIIHLNIAIDKYIILKEYLLYTDGMTMWKSNEFLTDDITFRQFIIKQVKDFVKCGDQLICTTYSNLIYIIPIDDNTSYYKALPTEEYCKAEELLNNAEYLYRILEEIEQNKDMVKKVKEEGNYISVLALSNRQDIMDTIIQQHILVYESYEDVLKEHTELLLTDKMNDYFEKDSVLFVIKISTKILQQMFSNILANLFNDLQIHLSFFSNSKLLKTTSLKLKESLKKISLLTSLKIKNAEISEINVIIKLISSIPGSHDRKQSLWSCLYEKHITLKSEHFIKTDAPTAHNTNLNDPEDSIENLIYKLENNYHRQLFRFVDISRHSVESSDWSMYLKLPANYKDLLMANDRLNDARESLNAKTADFLIKQYTSKDFLESKIDILLQIGKGKVKVQIIDDFSAPLLQVSSQNIIAAYNIRNFFSKLIYNDFKSQEGVTSEFVKYTLYNVTENLQKEIKACLSDRPSLEEFKMIAEHFERSVIGSLPL